MTLKFARTPGGVNRKIIDYETEAGEALYKRATRSLYSDSKGKFTLTSEGFLPFLFYLLVM